MANKTISMSKIRQILKLRAQGLGKRKLASTLGVSKRTAIFYLERFQQINLPLEQVLKLSDHELSLLFHPPQQIPVTEKLKQMQERFPEIEKKLGRKGMTLSKFYREYREKYPDGYGETQFYHYYRSWNRKIKLSMHIEHIIGNKGYVDFAGSTLPYVEAGSGELKEAQVFVAILGWSQYPYVEAMRDQTVEEFIAGCENAFHEFGGVPAGLVPDNLKSAVFKANRYEPGLNENFKAFAAHYGFTILPARVRKPQDKAHVENMVKITYQRVYANLPEAPLPTLDELNSRIRHLMKESNQIPLTGIEQSRTERLLMEREFLQPLPQERFELLTIKQVTVMKNGHIILSEDKHYYSVPHQLTGKKLRLQYSRVRVFLYLQYQLVASFERVRSPHNYTTDVAHLAPQHRYINGWSPGFFIEGARAIDPVVELYICKVLEKKQHPEQAYKSCQGILSFAKRVGSKRLIAACKLGHQIGYYNYKTIEEILKNNRDKLENEQSVDQMPRHGNIRGSDYYK